MKTDSKTMWKKAILGGEIYFLMGNKIVTPVSDGTSSVVATIEEGMEMDAQYLLRQAQLGGQTKRLTDRFIADITKEGDISCPIWAEGEDQDKFICDRCGKTLSILLQEKDYNFDPICTNCVSELLEIRGERK